MHFISCLLIASALFAVSNAACQGESDSYSSRTTALFSVLVCCTKYLHKGSFWQGYRTDWSQHSWKIHIRVCQQSECRRMHDWAGLRIRRSFRKWRSSSRCCRSERRSESIPELLKERLLFRSPTALTWTLWPATTASGRSPPERSKLSDASFLNRWNNQNQSFSVSITSLE